MQRILLNPTINLFFFSVRSTPADCRDFLSLFLNSAYLARISASLRPGSSLAQVFLRLIPSTTIDHICAYSRDDHDFDD